MRFVALPVVRRARHLCVFLCISRARSRVSPFTRLCASFKWCAACLVLFWRRRRRKLFPFFCESFLKVENRETQRSIDRIDRHATFSHVRLVGVRKTAHRSFSSSVVEQKSISFFFFAKRERENAERAHIQKQLLLCSAFPSSLLVRYAREREREREKNTRGRPQSKRILFKRR